MSKILEGNILKKAHQKESFTKQQIEELKKCSHDKEYGYYYFITNYCHVQHPTRGKVLFKPFKYQEDLLYNYHNYRLSINMLARQLGKCVDYETNITVRHKETGEEQTLPIGEFFEKVVIDPTSIVINEPD
ncbi:terminase large subunit [Salicola phage SCTP-2]|nr:terminase large subunit [Salicola phage SCTP-2]